MRRFRGGRSEAHARYHRSGSRMRPKALSAACRRVRNCGSDGAPNRPSGQSRQGLSQEDCWCPRDDAVVGAPQSPVATASQLSGRDGGPRYAERTNSERVRARLKDDDSGRHFRVRGPAKVSCYLMFGILALTVEPPQRLLLRTPRPQTDPGRFLRKQRSCSP